MKLCKVCFAYCEPGRLTCPFCGAEFPVRDPREMPAETTAELVARQGEPDALKADFFARQVTQAKLHGFKPGYASALFKERYGAWPPREWGDKVKAEFDKDKIWQDSLERRLKKKAAREAQEKKESEAVGEVQAPTATSVMEKMREQFKKAQTLLVASPSEEERQMEATVATMESPEVVAEEDPWQLAPDIGTDFDDWLKGAL
jgi:hypothetical protein